MNEFENNNLNNNINNTNNANYNNSYNNNNNYNNMNDLNNQPKYDNYDSYNNYDNGYDSIDYSSEIIDCSNTANNNNTASYNNYQSSDYTNQNSNPENQNISDYITIKNTEEDKKPKKTGKLKKAVALVSACAVCCAAVGVGVGIGFNSSKNLLKGAADTDFSFPETAPITTNGSSDSSNVLLTSTNTIAPIINKVKNSVVNISIKTSSTGFFNQVVESEGAGSGIIYDQDDEKVYIVTNNHVIDGATSVNISITGTEQVPASLVGKDASSDIAVIYVLKSDLAAAGINEVTVATFADSDKMEVGEYVLALGNALGDGKTVTQGIISAENKEINIDGKKLTVLQTDAAINPGNSGGALINTDGEVVGINTAKLATTSVEGIGYAIPASVVKTVIADITANGTVEKPYFGIAGFTINDAFKKTYNLDIDGVFISRVEEGSSAANAGLQYTDIITSFNGTPIATIEDLSKAITSCKVNDTVSLEIVRNGVKKMTLNATLSSSNQKF